MTAYGPTVTSAASRAAGSTRAVGWTLGRGMGVLPAAGGRGCSNPLLLRHLPRRGQTKCPQPMIPAGVGDTPRNHLIRPESPNGAGITITDPEERASERRARLAATRSGARDLPRSAARRG